MNRNCFSGAVSMGEISRSYCHCGIKVLSLASGYPKICLCGNPSAQLNINNRIKSQVNCFISHGESELYCEAVVGLKAACENGYPFHSYETVLNYETAYNQNCHLSLYRDQYEFTGGAHGSTIRASDTWNLSTGKRLCLSQLFSCGKDYKAFLIAKIREQADKNMEQDPSIYFEEYKTLICDNFNENNFHLSPRGLSIYYQQYEIAPYATGIVTFTIPYRKLGWQPSC
ncbi:MAG: DUF3298 and DUF4163 domain-containing protein [Clostridiales bacterium]|nr:DUF3298 and DUF4163 domain-containing protein [Clostridiales bacterium]